MGGEEVGGLRADPFRALLQALANGVRDDPKGALLYAAIAFAGLWALAAFKASLPTSPQELEGSRLAERTRRAVTFTMMGLQVVGMAVVYSYTRSVQTVGALLALYAMRWYLEFKGGTDAPALSSPAGAPPRAPAPQLVKASSAKGRKSKKGR